MSESLEVQLHVFPSHVFLSVKLLSIPLNGRGCKITQLQCHVSLDPRQQYLRVSGMQAGLRSQVREVAVG